MGDIIEFPSHKHRVEQLLNEALRNIKVTNPLLEQRLRETVHEIKNDFDRLTSSPPRFSFTSSGDSLQKNEDELRFAVLKLTEEYNKIILDIFAQLAVLKIENCKLTYEKL